MMESCCLCSQFYLKEDLRIMRRCKHTFCCKCMVEYFKEFTIEKMKCLYANCTAIIPDKIIRECLSESQTKVYDQLSVMKSSQSAIKCLTNGCVFMTICEEKDLIFECDFCKAPNCTKCRKRHYANECNSGCSNEGAIESRAREMLKEKSRLEFLELQRKFCLIPNPNSFECPICEEFILPRMGIILRKCLHCFCLICLSETIKAKKFLSHMTCSIDKCNQPLDQCEILVIINESRLSEMTIKEATSKFFPCKNGDCPGVWDISSEKGSYECPSCGIENCIDCRDIHRDMSCQEFRRTKQYISAQDQFKIFSGKKGVNCFSCSRLLIKKDGCNAMFCSSCGHQTCLFTGKIPGVHEVTKCNCRGATNCRDINNYCGCIPSDPCDKNCLFGCFPENQ